jgi:hypothetical protein
MGVACCSNNFETGEVIEIGRTTNRAQTNNFAIAKDEPSIRVTLSSCRDDLVSKTDSELGAGRCSD